MTFGAGAIAFGVVILLLTTVVYTLLGRSAFMRLRIDEGGVHLDPFQGSTQLLAWDDPRLKFNVNHFLRDANSILPKGDVRRSHPYWLSVWKFPSPWLQFNASISPEACEAIIGEAGRHSVTRSTSPVAFYWEFSLKGSGSLGWSDGSQLKQGQVMNGQITKIRGLAWGGDNDA